MGNVLRIYDKQLPHMDLETLPHYYRHDKPADPLLEQLMLTADQVVLHLGSGDGEITFDIARRLEALGGVGVVFSGEFSDRLVKELEAAVIEQQLEERVRVMPLAHVQSGVLPLADSSVDRLIAVNVFQYLEPGSPYFGELTRVLKGDGIAILADRRMASVPAEDEDIVVERMMALRDNVEQLGRTSSVLGYTPRANWVLKVG